jgi:hypothetical protein
MARQARAQRVFLFLPIGRSAVAKAMAGQARWAKRTLLGEASITTGRQVLNNNTPIAR